MTELMRSFAGQLNSGSLERAADDLAYSAATLQPTHGRARSQKHPATGSSRSRLSQIGRNCPPDFEGQRQRPFVTTFAANPQAGLSPINIAQLQKNDFSGAQPKTRKQQQNGPIAYSPSKPDERMEAAWLLESTPSTIQLPREPRRQDRF